MLDFKPSSSGGRKLREQSVHSSTALVLPGKRNLQEEQVASFDVRFKLTNNQDNTKSNNRVQIDAAANVNVAWYYVTSAVAAVAAWIVI